MTAAQVGGKSPAGRGRAERGFAPEDDTWDRLRDDGLDWPTGSGRELDPIRSRSSRAATASRSGGEATPRWTRSAMTARVARTSDLNSGSWNWSGSKHPRGHLFLFASIETGRLVARTAA